MMFSKNDKIIGKILTEENLIEKPVLEEAAREISDSKENLIMALAKKEGASEERMLKAVAKRLGILYVDLKKISIEEEAIESVPLKSAAYYKIMPIKIKKGVLTVASSYPLDIKIQDDIRVNLGYKINLVLAKQSDILGMLEKYYGLGAGTVEGILAQKLEQKETKESKETGSELEDIEKLAGDASVIRLVNQIILDAYKKRATDIHIEPYRNRIKLRYRIDGVLYNTSVPPKMKNLFSAILSRIKIMSNLDIVERRLPQDGRIVVKIQNETLDLRVSFMPTPYGESVVLRVLSKKMFFGLKGLGLLPKDLDLFENIIKKPHGIIFVTGPTGSGKTTTLYACLSKINTDQSKIITIEDPIEYEVEDITQVQVKPQIGLSFARGLRSLLRHDPDVVMVGEVRDLETAQIAIRVALTGHLVFSTLHTNDAAGGITRLIDIGIEPYLVASSVEAFVAQRLVRIICPECKTEDKDVLPETKEEIQKDLNLDLNAEIKFYKGKGCESCNQTGFLGRTAIYEILLLKDPAVKELILNKASAEQIRKAAAAKRMRTLRQNGWNKVIEGITTVEEVMRVTPAREKNKKANVAPKNTSLETQREAKEKRVFSRAPRKIKMQYRMIKSSSKELVDKEKKYTVTTEDVSVGGLSFDSYYPIPVGSILETNIKMREKGKTLQCLGKIVRAELVVADKVYKTGVSFLDMSGAERKLISEYIAE